MPLYEYKCEKCGATFELIQKLTEPPKKKCSKCGGSLKKIITAPALQFKGSGFYITDYAKKDKEPAESESKAKLTKDTVKETSSSDKKPKKESASSVK